MRPGALRLLWLPLFAAVLAVASLPGWIAGPLAFLFVVPRVAFWEHRGPWWGDALGGFLFWVLCFSFLEHTHWMMAVLAAAALWWWWVVQRWLYFRLRRLAPASVAGALAILTVELFRGMGIMGGVPWGSLALGLAEVPGALFLARGVGEPGLVVLVGFTGAFLYALARRRSPWELAPAPALWVVAVLAAAVSPGPPEPVGRLHCLAVQPNLALDVKTAPQRDFEVFEANLAPMREARDAGVRPDLILWAETMYPYALVTPWARGEVRRPLRGSDRLRVEPVDRLRQLQRQDVLLIASHLAPGGYFITGSHFYEGVPEDAPEGTISPRTSEMLAFNDRGELVAHRPKSRLVPFGETLPFGGALPGSTLVAKWIFDVFGLHPLIRREPPGGPLRLPRPGGKEVLLGSAVCWENPYEQVFRRQAAQGAQAFVVLSNEAWFGLGSEMEQMLAATRFRAVETGCEVLRVTNTGLSVRVDATGEPRERLPRGEAGWMAADLFLAPSGHATAYGAAGWLLLPATAAVALLLVVLSFVPRRTWPGRALLDPFSGQG